MALIQARTMLTQARTETKTHIIYNMEKTYDFDRGVERHGSDCYKWDGLQREFGSADLTALWVADMDFATPPFILDAMRERLDHPVLGYELTPDRFWQSIQDWQQERHGWTVEREWLTFVPGVVRGIGMAIQALTKPGEKVIIQPPVYHPFRLVPQAMGREVVMNPLRQQPDGTYRMDLEQLEQVIDKDCRLLILCNPHNPAGITWDAPTLAQLAEICSRRGVTVISDEIHGDLALFGHRHTPFATVSPTARDISITFGAPSKTFNMAGLACSWAIVPNAALRQRFYGWMEAAEFNDPPMLITSACTAALTQGEGWRKQLISYLEDNVRFVEDFCQRHIPAIRPLRPEASFLVWLDCRQLGLTQPQLVDFFLQKAHLALNDGSTFGPGGEGFMRLNIGCPRATLQKALEQLAEAVKTLQNG